MLTECFVLAVLAGAGLALLAWVPAAVPQNVLDGLPYWFDFGITPRLAVSALALAAFSAVVAGALPAWSSTKPDVGRNLQRAYSGTSGRRFGGWTGALVVIDIAVSVTVIGFLAGAGGFVKDAWAMQADRVGFADEEYLAASLLTDDWPGRIVDSTEGRDFTDRFAAMQRALVERLEAEPGVGGVAVADILPRMEAPVRRVEVDDAGAAGTEDDSDPSVARLVNVGAGFFAALGTRVVSGRDFSVADIDAGTAIVNETFVEQHLGGRNAVGRRVRHRGVVGRAQSLVRDRRGRRPGWSHPRGSRQRRGSLPPSRPRLDLSAPRGDPRGRRH